MDERYSMYASFEGRVLIIGYGSVARAALLLILRHIAVSPGRVTVLTRNPIDAALQKELGVQTITATVTPENYQQILDDQLGEGDILLHLTAGISSYDLIAYCLSHGICYMDASLEEWPGVVHGEKGDYRARCDYYNRMRVRSLDSNDASRRSTAFIANGANPGLVSYFLKAGLLDIARDTGVPANPHTREEWAALAEMLQVKVVHVSERDTQRSVTSRTKGVFRNTWSPEGLYGEAVLPAEVGWGTHEKELPKDAKLHDTGTGSAIGILRPGCTVQARSWVPLTGPLLGMVISHNETLAFADYYTVRNDAGEVVYRPTCHYVYYPADDALASLREVVASNFERPRETELLIDDIVSDGGTDELGVLIAGHAKNAYWIGTSLTIEEARKVGMQVNATSLQVAAGILAGMVWIIEHPHEGIIEADDVDHVRALAIAAPYLGTIKKVYTDWTPLAHLDTSIVPRGDRDLDDPWQFKNIYVP
ncbi:hypothetical protein A3C87_03575 [Candidatus Kaiserbacteria bacterium RIFCSPHIGHO2_02_FULL_49_34]|uniref:Homospermidine synthase n=1 Tax=Candidatus Kaiserbacteria bacterium RIFCSPHIGHO2_02_FULL_49_34 TaxID=1798491 RepID=A0A1F6DJK5_9BACT|nr:MAG: hypothetical protein A3C87_03575 [Candidatus Kaiserbacteria bacterium RIFCSPHIGHO2_02_FULL_49_34]